MQSPKWDSSAHRAIQDGGGAEEQSHGIKGGDGSHIQVFQHVWTPPEYGELFQVLGASDLGGRR